jgi:hypothetical protein
VGAEKQGKNFPPSTEAERVTLIYTGKSMTSSPAETLPIGFIRN